MLIVEYLIRNIIINYRFYGKFSSKLLWIKRIVLL